VDLFIEIIDGPLQGSRTPLRDGLTLGRSGCDVNLEDPKVSSKHAELEMRPDGSFWLIDRGSANGIRAEGTRLTELVMAQGTVFRLGRTRFRVFATGVAPTEGLQTKVKNLFKKPSQKKSANDKSWRDQIVFLSERVIREMPVGKRKDSGLQPFHHVLTLAFNRGIQSGTEWVLGYGPREIGSSSVDLPLFEPGLPAKCFKIVPKASEAIIRVSEEAHGKILLNGKRFESSFLRPGDVIEIGNTRIEISFET
jgi:pSer/pThr/pTyr-binding forkhead associated (FHA) protein